MVLALLWAQGLQICIHAAEETAADSTHAQAGIVDFESTLTVLGNSQEQATDVDIPLSATLKSFQSGFALLFVAVLLHVLFVPRQLLSAKRLPETPPRTPRGYDWRPPLRAPPR